MGKNSHSLKNNYETKTGDYETKTGDYETRVNNYDKEWRSLRWKNNDLENTQLKGKEISYILSLIHKKETENIRLILNEMETWSRNWKCI